MRKIYIHFFALCLLLSAANFSSSQNPYASLWDAAFYSDNVRNNNADGKFLAGKKDVGNLVEEIEGGWFENSSIKFANDAIICFLTCRAAKENDDITLAKQLTLKTGITTIAASGGVNRNDTGSPFVYKTFKQKKEKDTDAGWYKFERVNEPTTFLGIKIKDNFSIKKTPLEHRSDTKDGKYIDVRDYLTQ